MNTFFMVVVSASVLLSVVSLVLAAYSLLRSENARLIACETLVRENQIEVAGLVNSYDQTRKTLNRINSRYAMREKRARDKQECDSDLPDPSTDPNGWREAIQRKYPRGVFSINGKGNG